MTAKPKIVAAVVLAAGMSSRMGSPKMILPWNGSTIVARVVRALRDGGAASITVVTGSQRERVEAALEGEPVSFAYNEDYANGEMLDSIQTGLRALPAQVDAALIALGDQPQIQAATVRQVLESYAQSSSKLVAPSYQMRRGHPWLVERELWGEILNLRHPLTLRDFMEAHAGDIRYLIVDTPTILQDVDTPEDYRRFRKQRE